MSKKPGQISLNLAALAEQFEALRADMQTINQNQHILGASLDNVANNLRAVNDLLGEDEVKKRSKELQIRDAEDEGAKKMAVLDAAVERGEVVAAATLTSAEDYAVLESRRPDGTVLHPRLSAGVVNNFHPDIQKAILGKSVGDTAKVESLNIDVTVAAIYTPNPDYVAPTAGSSTPILAGGFTEESMAVQT